MWLLARIPLPYPFNVGVFRFYIWLFSVNAQEIELPLKTFRNLNQFFIRTLKPELRSFSPDTALFCSPVDGTISSFGPIQNNQLIQVKGKPYSLQDLLGNTPQALSFQNGFFLTIYLSPKNYHRIHTSVDSEIQTLQYLPGTLFPVNTTAVQHISNLFPRNERLVTYFKNPLWGELAIVKVGAMNVGRIAVTFHPFQTNSWRRKPFIHTFEEPVLLKKGAELGRFEFGSTVVLLFPDTQFDMQIQEGQPICMGEPLAIRH